MIRANNTKLESIVYTEEDQNIIQKELNDLDDCSNRNGMKCYSIKCAIVHLGLI